MKYNLKLMQLMSKKSQLGVVRIAAWANASLLLCCTVQPEADGRILTYPMSASLSDTHANFFSGSPCRGPLQHRGPPSFNSVVYGNSQPDIESEWWSLYVTVNVPVGNMLLRQLDIIKGQSNCVRLSYWLQSNGTKVIVISNLNQQWYLATVYSLSVLL